MTDARRYDRANDPYYVVRDEIARHVDDLARRARSGAASATVSAALERDIESARWELDELDRAIAVAERESARYKLDAREIDERKRWSARAREAVDEAMATTRARARAGRANGDGDGDTNGTTTRTAGDAGVGEAGFDDHQQLLVRRQDEDLDDISASITRIGQVGLTIGEELASQSKMLEDLDEDVDGVNARLAAAERKMRDVLKKVGLRGQLCVIFFLTVVLFVLFAIAFQ